MWAFDRRRADVSARLAAIRDITEHNQRGWVIKLVLFVVAMTIIVLAQQSTFILVFAVVYLISDMSGWWHLERAERIWGSSVGALRAMCFHRWCIAGSFDAMALYMAFDGTYLLQLGALMMLTGHALHMLANHTASKDVMVPDVVCIIAAATLVPFGAAEWATMMERVLMHAALANLSVFFLYAAYQSYSVHNQLRTTSERLVNAQRAGVMGRLTGGIAHDFNNLLTVMRGNLDLIQVVPDEERPALLAQIEEATARGGELVARLSDAGRPDPNKARWVQLNQVAERAALMAKRTLPANVHLSTMLTGAPEAVRADPAELELALLNLLTNAADALPEGGRVVLSAVAEDDEHTRLTVEDNGIGMDADWLAVATEPYATTKPSGKGTGLGLAMVQAFVDGAGGRMEIESAPGRGTRISLYLRTTTPSTVAGQDTAA